ncbi:phosphomannomutase [Maritimibacter sp. DP1N21-5]|uniref:phosphomannomutase n=1 Tax=Maritimibacter sp. DP1N21-5 TaxID=2836867 RepID=UPI001C475962|nr:phosphomannomutase [Maritimibacter sp. DP1N21-5]MBV7408303.1 phosphomannomutase [Maritimibacter sp. DP1N21-5]
MAPKFGTSGLRGLVVDLTDALVADHIRAFLRACPNGGAIHVGRDLRPSSPAIAKIVLDTVTAEGLLAVDCGAVPTPALALGSMARGHAAVMITGSHIPADRNGLKFYVPGGEISKDDEAAIRAALGASPARDRTVIAQETAPDTAKTYVERYRAAYGDAALSGWRIGVYQHSSVARDLMAAVVKALGGVPVPLGRSSRFIPVDTEAVDREVAHDIRVWCKAGALDALISTDGDADRPLMADHAGDIVPGDVLGPLTAKALGASVIVTPVSSNSMVDEMGFRTVHRTRIGSPFVIAKMEACQAKDPDVSVVGYEANGGFLLGFAAKGPAGPLAPLMTRDCLLPIIAPLVMAREQGVRLADLVAGLPSVFTAADRVTEVPSDRSSALIATLSKNAGARAAFFEGAGEVAGIDETDGLRVTFETGEVVHLRPSGNAPECRCYAEAKSQAAAQGLLDRYLARLRDRLTTEPGA